MGIKKKILNLNDAKKYAGTATMGHAFIGQACIAGDGLCTSKIFAYIGKIQYESCQYFKKRRKYWHPLSLLESMKSRTQIIFEITKGMKNAKKIRKILLNKRVKKNIYSNLYASLLLSFKSFLEGIFIIISITKVSKSPRFWIELLINHFFRFCSNTHKRSRNRLFKYCIHHVVKFLDIVRLSYI